MTTQNNQACNSPLLPVDQAENETPLNLKQVAAMFPQRPSRKVLYQWRSRGVLNRHGETVFLEYFMSGGSLFSTVEAVDRFKRRCNGEDLPSYSKESDVEKAAKATTQSQATAHGRGFASRADSPGIDQETAIHAAGSF